MGALFYPTFTVLRETSVFWNSAGQEVAGRECIPPRTILFAWICTDSYLTQIYKKPKMGYGKINNRKLKIKQKSLEFRNYGMIVYKNIIIYVQKYNYLCTKI